MEHTCYKDDPPQVQESRFVRLIDEEDHEIHGFLPMLIWRGVPVGDWVEFQGKRIGLRELPDGRFQGVIRN